MDDMSNDDEPADDQEPHDIGTFVPAAARKMTEQGKSIEDDPGHQRAINEFTTEGYMSCAFPTLMPTGAGDYVVPRQRSVTVGNYFKHLMMYGDGQFARFRYFALNTEIGGLLSRQAGSTSSSTHVSHLMNWGTWLAVKENSYRVLPAACAVPASTGSSRGAG